MIHLVTKQNIKCNEGIRKASMEECMMFINRNSFILALDTETTGYSPFLDRLLTLQIGTPEDQFIVDATTYDVSILKLHLEKVKIMLAHNMKFDWQWLYHHGIDIRNIYDTFLAEAVLTTGHDTELRGLSLEACAIKYCGVQLNKTIRGKIMREGLSERVIIYAAQDTAHLFAIREKQLESIRKWELEKVLELENKVVRVFALMEYNGVLVNPKRWMAVAEKVEEDIQNTERELNKILTEEIDALDVRIKESDEETRKLLLERRRFLRKFEVKSVQYDMFIDPVLPTEKVFVNWSSNQQKLDIIVNGLGLIIPNVDNRKLIKIANKHRLIPVLIRYNKEAKLKSSFGRKFVQENINPNTGRVHPNYFQIVSTGRISCQDPNLLNIPSHGDLATKIRAAFVAREGYRIVGGDYSNFELRIIAECAEDPLWDKVFLEDGDLHTELCVKTFDIDYADVKKPFPLKPEYKYRDVQKTIDFGFYLNWPK